MLNNLLIYRLAIFNICAAATAGWAWGEGLVWPIFESDVSGLTYVIVVVFLFGLCGLSIRAVKVSRLMNDVKKVGRMPLAGPKLQAKNAFIGDIVEALVTLGLFGTFAGIWIAFSNVDAASLTTASAVAQEVPKMLAGIKVSIGTTLVGATCGLWLFTCNRMLKTATALLIEDAG